MDLPWIGKVEPILFWTAVGAIAAGVVALIVVLTPIFRLLRTFAVFMWRKIWERPKSGTPARSPEATGPPPPPEEYVPRQDKEDEAASLLLGGHSACVFGEPGMGKSSLAMQVANSPEIKQRFADGIWWVNAAGMDLRAMCETVASAVGTTEVAQAKSDDDRLGALRTVVGGRNMLVVLDNCENPDASHRFTDEGHRATLVTSQHRPRGPRRVDLGRMTDEQCLEILRRTAVRPLQADEQEPARKMVEILSGHPFAVALAGAQLEDASAQEILQGLRRSPWPMLRGRGRKGRAIKLSLDAAYKRLSGQERGLFAVLGVFGGPSFDLVALQAVTPPANAQRMDRLVRRSLVRQEDGRYALHPLVRRYAADRLDRNREAYKKMAEHYCHLFEDLGSDPTNFGRLDREIGNAFAAMDWCREVGEREKAARFAVALSPYLDVRGLWSEARKRLEQGLEMAESAGRGSLVSGCSHNLGIFAQNQGEYDEARRRYQQSLAVEEKSGNRSGVALTMFQLGNIAYITRDYAEADRLYRASLAVHEEVGDKGSVASTKHQLGMIAHDQGDYAEARRLYEASLAIQEEAGNKRSVAHTKHQLGMLAQDQGDFAEASDLYQESLAIKEALGDRPGVATTKHQLGILAQIVGDPSRARRLYEESLIASQALGDRSGIATSKHQLGVLAQDRGDLGEARRLYQESLDIEEGLGNRRGIAQSKHQLGMLAELEGNPSAARQLYEEAVAVFQALRSPDAEMVRSSLEQLAAAKPRGRRKKKK